MQADDLDHRPDLGLSAAQQDRPTPDAQAACEHRQVEHQRSVGEHQPAQIDDHVILGRNCADEGWTTASLRGSILVAGAA
jgi:hypothetical protein